MNIEKLKKMLCPRYNCAGYLYESKTSKGQEVYRCRDCHNYIDKGDYDVIVSGSKSDKVIDEIEKNLRELNNL